MPKIFWLLYANLAFHALAFAQAPANDLCSNAITLASAANCTTSSGSLVNATYTTTTGACGASSGNRNDVWYRFTAIATQATVAISGALTDGRFQIFTNNCSTPVSLFCSTGPSATFSGLTPGMIYYIRVYSNTNNSNTFEICVAHPAPTRMREVFRDEIVANNAAGLNSPWEITYGPDDHLWITESKNFLVRRLNPASSYLNPPPASTIVLDLTSTTWPVGIRRNYTVGAVVNGTATPDPQGGLMGLAIHPEFQTNPAKRFVYVAYVRQYLGLNQTYNGETVNGHLFLNNLVRFTYNPITEQLENPVVLCDTLRGSNDHNSGRMIIAPVNGTYFLFYASGDMGAGQFANINRTIKSQNIQSYEGKILRFNLEPDSDPAQSPVSYNQWIPNDNPYNNVAPVVGQSAVYNIGHRNVQGLSLIGNTLYASSHGPFSDDEVDVVEAGRNYGHPLVIGYSSDGNYNNAKAGPISSSLPLIGNEATNANNLPGYRDPIFSFYPAPAGNTSTPWSIQYIYNNVSSAQNQNQFWASIAPSGMEAYTHTAIPGWKNSLLLASLKKGFVMRIKPNAAGTGVESIAGADTAVLFNTQNRFRDLAIHPNGRTIFTIIDRSGNTSGPTSDNPVSSACAGCILKFTFLGYNHNGTTSTIPTGIPIDNGTANSCAEGTPVTINAANNNNNLWVPITGPDGNIVAEINANGNNLGTVTSSFFVKTGPARTTNGKPYLNRNITITPQQQPTTPVSVRLYFTAAELSNLQAADPAVTSVNDLSIIKTDQGCSGTYNGINATPLVVHSRYTQGSFGYVLQANTTGFSTFYFANANITLPFRLLEFTGIARGDDARLHWVVTEEEGIQAYELERSTDNRNFGTIAIINSRNGGNARSTYHYTDAAAATYANTLFYRLKVQNKEGNYQYSSVVRVSFTALPVTINLFPNPVGDVATLRIQAPADAVATLRIVDNTGRVVLHRSISLVKGINQQQLETAWLQPGLYYIDITSKDFSQKIKLIKR